MSRDLNEPKLVKVCGDCWVLDTNSLTGHKVYLDKDGNYKYHKPAFSVLLESNTISFDRYMKVPLKVIRNTLKYIDAHKEEFYESRLTDVQEDLL